MGTIFGIIGSLVGIFIIIFILFIVIGILKLFFGSLAFMGGFIIKTIFSWIFWILVIIICIALVL